MGRLARWVRPSSSHVKTMLLAAVGFLQVDRFEPYFSVFFVPFHGKEQASRRVYRVHVRRGASEGLLLRRISFDVLFRGGGLQWFVFGELRARALVPLTPRAEALEY